MSSLKSENSTLIEVAEQNRDIEDQKKALEGKYSCRQCNYQTSFKGDLPRHKRAVHQGVKYSCRQCNYQATYKGDLSRHKRAVHEEVKYSCRKCDQQFPLKSSETKHQREVHEGLKSTTKNNANQE